MRAPGLDVRFVEAPTTATASRSRVSCTWTSGSASDLMISTQPCSGRSSPASSRMPRARASQPLARPSRRRCPR